MVALQWLGLAVHAQGFASLNELAKYPPSDFSGNLFLQTPSSPNRGVPVGMDATGRAIGFGAIKNGLVYDATARRYVQGYTHKALAWEVSSAAKVTPVALSSTMVPLHVNASGSWAGFIPSKSAVTSSQFGVQGAADTPAVQVNGKVTKLNASTTGGHFLARGINSQNWVLGMRWGGLVGGLNELNGLIWRNGAVTDLDKGPYVRAYPVQMNDAGQVIGSVMRETNTGPNGEAEIDERAAFWDNGKLSWTGPKGSMGLSINAAGQYLVGYRDGNAMTLHQQSSVQALDRDGIHLEGTVGRVFINSTGAVLASGTVPAPPYTSDLYLLQGGRLNSVRDGLVSAGLINPNGASLITHAFGLNDRGHILTSAFQTLYRINPK
jgi:hypothetical protein